MAFNQIVELKIGKAPELGSSGVGVLVSDLNVEFEVVRTVSFSNNKCNLTIYNAKEDTRNNILTPGNNIVLDAGYEDEGIGTIFIGNITNSSSTYDGKTWTTNIESGGLQKADRKLSYQTITISYAPNTLVTQVLNELSTALGLALFGTDNALGIILPNGYSYAGTAKTALNYCKKMLNSNGVGLYIDNSAIVLYKIGKQDSRFRTVYLDYDSGLINAYIENESYRVGNSLEDKPRIKYKCLLNPNLEPNGLVTIKTDYVDGVFINEKVTYKGGNFGNEFICEGEAVE